MLPKTDYSELSTSSKPFLPKGNFKNEVQKLRKKFHNQPLTIAHHRYNQVDMALSIKMNDKAR